MLRLAAPLLVVALACQSTAVSKGEWTAADEALMQSALTQYLSVDAKAGPFEDLRSRPALVAAGQAKPHDSWDVDGTSHAMKALQDSIAFTQVVGTPKKIVKGEHAATNSFVKGEKAFESIGDDEPATTAAPATAAGGGGAPAVTGKGCPADCSGHGDCDKETLKCTCKSPWTGKKCDTQPCPNDCSGNGKCDGATGACTCNPPFTGKSDCSEAVCTVPDCSGHGTCDKSTGACVCTSGWGGEGCDKAVCPNSCSGQGTCKDFAGTKTCECNKGFKGEDCSKKECPSNCNGADQGTCDDSTGTCTCKPGWKGAACDEKTEVVCPGGGTCSGNGECNKATGVCTCKPGYKGTDCSEVKCPKDCSAHGECNSATGQCACDVGYSGPACADLQCPGDCNGHGECNKATGECICSAGWTGSACKKVMCPTKNDNECSGKGVCSIEKKACVCFKGFTGPDCSTVECPKNCSGRGVCDEDAVCICEPGFFGAACDKMRCPGGKNCSGHGTCMDSTGKCMCDKGWGGESCNMTTAMPVPSPVQPAPPKEVSTVLASPALLGAKSLAVASIEGFEVGRAILINPNSTTEEDNIIVGFSTDADAASLASLLARGQAVVMLEMETQPTKPKPFMPDQPQPPAMPLSVLSPGQPLSPGESPAASPKPKKAVQEEGGKLPPVMMLEWPIKYSHRQDEVVLQMPVGYVCKDRPTPVPSPNATQPKEPEADDIVAPPDSFDVLSVAVISLVGAMVVFVVGGMLYNMYNGKTGLASVPMYETILG